MNRPGSTKQQQEKMAWTQERYLRMREKYVRYFPEMLDAVDLLAKEQGLTVPVHDKDSEASDR
jgi:hypothetical protein